MLDVDLVARQARVYGGLDVDPPTRTRLGPIRLDWWKLQSHLASTVI